MPRQTCRPRWSAKCWRRWNRNKMVKKWETAASQFGRRPRLRFLWLCCARVCFRDSGDFTSWPPVSSLSCLFRFTVVVVLLRVWPAIVSTRLSCRISSCLELRVFFEHGVFAALRVVDAGWAFWRHGPACFARGLGVGPLGGIAARGINLFCSQFSLSIECFFLPCSDAELEALMI